MTKKVSNAQLRAQERYDKVNTVQVHLKLNRKTDSAIIKKLIDVGNVQGYIKRLITNDIGRNRTLNEIESKNANDD